jgi:hypothetical protein
MLLVFFFLLPTLASEYEAYLKTETISIHSYLLTKVTREHVFHKVCQFSYSNNCNENEIGEKEKLKRNWIHIWIRIFAICTSL